MAQKGRIQSAKIFTECACGCGQMTPNTWVHGHNQRRAVASQATRDKLSAAMTGKRCPDGCECRKHVFSLERKANISRALMGTFHGVSAAGSFIDAYGYRVLTGQWSHPLALASGVVQEHRKVLYAKTGPGPHRCYHCDKVIDWKSSVRGTDLCVDHLDDDRLNNDPTNLVPSCFRCNWGRNRQLKTHCIHGHEYTDENTYINSSGRRECRTCRRARNKKNNQRYRSRKKASSQ